jgi:hypothetical protein
MASPITAEQIIGAISIQINPAIVAKLKDENACNTRLNRCVYLMHEAAMRGLDIRSVITQAMARYDDTDSHCATTMCSLVKNYNRMVRFGCLTDENLLQLKKRNAATITKGRYTGQKMEVDHIVPKSLMPTLAKDFVNLCFQPQSINLEKSDAIARAQLRAVNIFARHGIVPHSTVDRMRQLQGLSVRAARATMPGAVAHLKSVPALSGLPAGATDPRIIIVSLEQLIERVADWEPRADAALSTADLIQRQTAEHLTRTQALLSQAQSRAEDDVNAARRLETELANMHSLGEKVMSRAEQCIESTSEIDRRSRRSKHHWSREEKFAGNWQRRAEQREDKAREQVDKAQEALNRAENALSNAEAALERARHRTRPVGRDSQGKTIYEPIDTTPYENRVREIEDRVQRCESRLNTAQDWLRQATRERQAAEARVGACAQAAQLASESETAAASAMQSARIALTAVERASEEHTRAASLTEQAGKAAHWALAAVSVFAKHTNQASALETDAATNLQSAQNNHASSRQRSTLGSMEINWRVQQLRAFDGSINEF